MAAAVLPIPFGPDVHQQFWLFIPLLGLACLAGAFVCYALPAPRPYALGLFFVCALLAALAAAGPWEDYALPSLLGMALGAGAGGIEIVARRLWRQVPAVVLAIAACCSYYFLLVSAAASAAV